MVPFGAGRAGAPPGSTAPIDSDDHSDPKPHSRHERPSQGGPTPDSLKQEEGHSQRGQQARPLLADPAEPRSPKDRGAPGQKQERKKDQHPEGEDGEDPPRQKPRQGTDRHKGTPPAEPHPPEPQHLARIGLAERMVGIAVEAVRPPRQAVDAPGGAVGDPPHRWLGRTTTAVP